MGLVVCLFVCCLFCFFIDLMSKDTTSGNDLSTFLSGNCQGKICGPYGAVSQFFVCLFLCVFIVIRGLTVQHKLVITLHQQMIYQIFSLKTVKRKFEVHMFFLVYYVCLLITNINTKMQTSMFAKTTKMFSFQFRDMSHQ